MPLFGNQQQNQGTAVWEPPAADGRLAQTAGANPAASGRFFRFSGRGGSP